MQLIHADLTAGVVVVDPDSTDPIVIANPGLPPRVVAERAEPYLGRRARLDLDHALHGGLPVRVMLTVCWGGFGLLVGACLFIAVTFATDQGPARPGLVPTERAPVGSVAPSSAPSSSVPPTTRPRHTATGVISPATTAPPTTAAPPATKKTPPGQVGKIGPYGLIRRGVLPGSVTTTTLDPDELEELCDLLELVPCPPDLQVVP